LKSPPNFDYNFYLDEEDRELIDHLSDYSFSSICFVKLFKVLQRFEILVVSTKLTNLEDKPYPTQQEALKLGNLKGSFFVHSLILTKD
jgi:hypothetical protein